MDFGFDNQLILLSFVVSLASTLALTPLARWVALRAGVVDRPDGKRKLQKRPIPLLGGTAIWASLAIALGSVALLSGGQAWARITGVLGSAGLLCLIGVYDDVWNLRARWKLAAQVVAMLPLLAAGFSVEKLGFGGHTLAIGAGGTALTIVWLLLSINALNLIDGMDGLAATTCLSIVALAAAIAYCAGAGETVAIAAALAGAMAGFLAYNFPPATIYMGDAGSMVVGLMLGLVTMGAAAGLSGACNPTIMVLLMAVPIGDTLLAIIRRLLSGRGISCPDRGHLHHRLLDRGFSAPRVLAVVASMCVLCGLMVVATRAGNWDIVAWLGCAALGMLFVRARLLGHHEWAQAKSLAIHTLRVEPVGLPRAEDLADMSFDAAWKRLTSTAARFGLSRLHLSIAERGRAARHHFWYADELGQEDHESTDFEIRFHSGRGEWCSLRLEARDELRLGRFRWLKLLHALTRFGQHWANAPQSVPGEAPALYPFAERPLIPSQPVQRRRAA